MTKKKLYGLVYRVVRNAQKTEKQVFLNNPEMYAWSLLIPEPKNTSEKMAAALCASVSRSTEIGLELYFQEKVYHGDLVATIKNAADLQNFEKQLIIQDKDGDNFEQLGRIIRTNFKGDNGLSEEYKLLLASIK